MGILHRLVRLLPARLSEAMEAESRLWVLRCPCGYEQSVWDMGGVRYKAYGNSRHPMRCRECGKLTVHVMTKLEG